MAQLDFDSSGLDREKPLEPLMGDFVGCFTGSDVTPNSARTGKVLKLVGQVLEGPHKGRRFFDNLNISNPNQEAERISKARLATILDVCGKGPKVPDSVVLHNIPFIVTMGVDKKAQPRVKGYKPFTKAEAPSDDAPASSEGGPWKNKRK